MLGNSGVAALSYRTEYMYLFVLFGNLSYLSILESTSKYLMSTFVFDLGGVNIN